MQNLIPLAGIAVFRSEKIQERIRSIVEALLLELLPAHRVLVVREALDTEEVPRAKRVKEEPLPCALSPRPDPQRLCRIALE